MYIERQGMHSGIVKVAYPKDWCAHQRLSSIFSVSQITIYIRQTAFERKANLGVSVRLLEEHILRRAGLYCQQKTKSTRR